MSAENPERNEMAANEDEDESPDVEGHKRHFGGSDEPAANEDDDDTPDVEGHRRHF